MLKISSPLFNEGDAIPEKYTCKGEGVNPELDITGVPSEAKSLALIMHDPDAPREGGFTHWVVVSMGAQTTKIAENSVPADAVEGLNGAGKPGYTAPCPPSGTHRYFFYLYALDTVLKLPEDADKAKLEQAMEGHVVEKAELMGTVAK